MKIRWRALVRGAVPAAYIASVVAFNELAHGLLRTLVSIGVAVPFTALVLWAVFPFRRSRATGRWRLVRLRAFPIAILLGMLAFGLGTIHSRSESALVLAAYACGIAAGLMLFVSYLQLVLARRRSRSALAKMAGARAGWKSLDDPSRAYGDERGFHVDAWFSSDGTKLSARFSGGLPKDLELAAGGLIATDRPVGDPTLDERATISGDEAKALAALARATASLSSLARGGCRLRDGDLRVDWTSRFSTPEQFAAAFDAALDALAKVRDAVSDVPAALLDGVRGTFPGPFRRACLRELEARFPDAPQTAEARALAPTLDAGTLALSEPDGAGGALSIARAGGAVALAEKKG